MSNRDHLRRLKKRVGWNEWRYRNKNLAPDLSNLNLEGIDLNALDLRGVDLSGSYLAGADLSRADLTEANLHNITLARAKLDNAYFTRANLADADLTDADLFSARLTRANMSRADLSRAELTNTILENADLTGADLGRAMVDGAVLLGARLTEANLGLTNFTATDLRHSDFMGARLFETIFADVDLSGATGLENCDHCGPSVIDFRSLLKSGALSVNFLRGVGLPDNIIKYLPSLLNPAIRRYSYFISYSALDQDFVERLHADLQQHGVRCWFALRDMPIGGKILDEISTAIRLRDKLLLVLSENAIGSAWVEDEVTKAFEEERKRGQIVLFPVRLDDAVMNTTEAWASKLRARHIGDFRSWKDYDAYRKEFERILRDLAITKEGSPDSR